MSYSSHGECISVGVKAHVLYSRILKEETFWGLLNCDSVAEITDQLKNTEGYGPHLETLPPREIHRHDLEYALKASLLTEANGFLLYFNGTRDMFFRAWVAWYEAENLKNIFRHVMSDNTDRERLRRRLFLIPGTALSYDALLMARNFGEIGEALRGTVFYRVLIEPLKRLVTGEEKSLFPLEMAVDTLVENALYKAMMRLESSARRLLMPIFGARIDLLNTYIIYRALTFYHMSPEETLNRLLPVRHKIQLSQLRRLCRSGTLAEALEILEETSPAYAAIFKNSLQQPEPQLALERNINRFLYLQALRVYRTGAPGFHTAISYFLLREFEIKDLIKIIEDVRYDYDRRHAVSYLTRPILSGGDVSWQ